MLHISHQREELDIELEGKKLTQRDNLVTARTTTTKAARVRKQLGPKIARVTIEGSQTKNGGETGVQRSLRERGEEQMAVGCTLRKDG